MKAASVLAALGAASIWSGGEASAPPAAAPLELATAQALTVDLPVCDVRVSRAGDGARGELLVVARDGRVHVLGADGAAVLALRGEFALPDPDHALVCVSEFDAERPGEELLAAGPAGLQVWARGAQGTFESAARTASSRAKFTLRTGEPRPAAIAQDVNADGRADAVLPAIDAVELWLNDGVRAGAPAQPDAPAWTLPTLRRTARVPVEVDRTAEIDADEVSDVLVSAFSIPSLRTRDVNGDGRPDLLVEDKSKRSFHLQAEDGSFPTAPTVQVDLSIFRDTTASGGIAPGRTLALEGEATFESRDLDRDGVPDYVIAHRRKVWVFLGKGSGPQFTQPLTILKTAEDVTALTLAQLDDDGYADMVLFKLQVPTIATLLRGLLGDWDVQVGAVGYRNQAGKGFEGTPSFRSDLVVRLPSIVGILKNPGEILSRFEDVKSRFRLVEQGDFDGDGKLDLALVAPDSKRLDVWLATGASDAALDADRALREVFFESPDRVWDLDRIVLWLGGMADRLVALRTGGRAADASGALRKDAALRLATLDVVDLDGDGRAELVAGYRPADGRGACAFDVLRLSSK